ncbi:hypothetical protein PRUPE_6G188800 [Prunus persica]|uniref:Uncharacterized protein n=1 Tax=Prunus persica TaxID=3760 RepID=A0A251NV90_PRUPE|nr:hypothetical protein PRUPE_6G188800 [Prunus persica]
MDGMDTTTGQLSQIFLSRKLGFSTLKAVMCSDFMVSFNNPLEFSHILFLAKIIHEMTTLTFFSLIFNVC